MLDNLTKKLAEKMGRGVKKAAEPLRTEVKNTVSSKVDLYSRILRMGVLLLLFLDGTRRITNDQEKSKDTPNQIIINNYIGKDGDC